MSRQAIVGLFTLLGFAALFAVFVFLANLNTGNRYKIGIHFKSAAGLHRGALVYESGVIVGVVDATQLLPEDFTVDVIAAINNNVDIPRDSKFVITAPLTGDTTLEIVPPPPAARPVGIVGPTPVPQTVALLPRQVLPLEQQPAGYNPASLQDLLEEGQGEVHRLDRMLAELERREPELLGTLQSALTNANDLTREGSKRLFRLADRLDTLTTTLQVALDAGSKNLVDLSGQLDDTVRRNTGNVDAMFTNLNKTSVALNQTVDQVRDLASNPQVRQNLLDTTKGLAQTATTIAQITEDFRTITGNPQTQAQLRDTIANTDAATQKLNALLKSLGATSSVYGVDAGATPAPVPAPHGSAPAAAAGGAAGTVASGTIAATANAANAPTVATVPENLKDRLGAVARSLLALQIRISELDNYNVNATPQSTLLATSNRGPQSDVNLILLPHGKTSLFTGANDIGTPQQTWNVSVLQNMGHHFTVGGGVLYSQLGVLAQYNPSVLGLEVRAYNLAYPTIDAYGNVNVTPGVQLFGGERDILHAGRRTVFGLQLQF